MNEIDPLGLYHLLTPTELEVANETGSIRPMSLEAEGFVHCSWGSQVLGTVTKHFSSTPTLLLAKLNANLIAGDLVEEDSYGTGSRFPHVYAPIPLSAIEEVVELDR